jgi:hypothetical protein
MASRHQMTAVQRGSTSKSPLGVPRYISTPSNDDEHKMTGSDIAEQHSTRSTWSAL